VKVLRPDSYSLASALTYLNDCFVRAPAGSQAITNMTQAYAGTERHNIGPCERDSLLIEELFATTSQNGNWFDSRARTRSNLERANEIGKVSMK
jgi:hypothetical protein